MGDVVWRRLVLASLRRPLQTHPPSGRFFERQYLKHIPHLGGFLEVDLHIKAFMRNTSGLSAEDMVQLSLDRMREALDKAIDKGQQEIQFIHGMGTGSLKERVYGELRVYERQGKIASFEPSFFNPGVVKVLVFF